MLKPSGPFAVLLTAALLWWAGAALAAGVVVVPPGNRNATQPTVSRSSTVRTAETGSSFDAKYQAVYASLAADPDLIGKIVKTSAIYGIDPIHLIGAIVGEHTYNVDVFDSLQGYYVKALSYLGASNLRFAYKGEDVENFVARPEFAECAAAANDYDLWTCRDRVWRDVFRGKKVGGIDWPDDRFERVFVPLVLVLAVVLLFAWVVVDEPFRDSFYRSMAVLVAASPCALAIATPSASPIAVRLGSIRSRRRRETSVSSS